MSVISAPRALAVLMSTEQVEYAHESGERGHAAPEDEDAGHVFCSFNRVTAQPLRTIQGASPATASRAEPSPPPALPRNSRQTRSGGRLLVLDTSDVNAFATPGYIGVNRGIGMVSCADASFSLDGFNAGPRTSLRSTCHGTFWHQLAPHGTP